MDHRSLGPASGGLSLPTVDPTLYDQGQTGQSTVPKTRSGNTMAHINLPPLNPRPNDPAQVRQPRPEERRAALAVLMTGRPSPDDPAVDHFLDFTRQQGMKLDGLWASFHQQTPVSSVLIIPTAGRAAVTFLSPISTRKRIPDASMLIKTAVQNQDAQKVSLIQSLLDPTQRLERDTLADAGFIHLASLVYMRSNCPRHPEPVPAGDREPDDLATPIELQGHRLTAITWQEDRFQAFADVITASYEDTLDCPGLVGLRKIEDIIAGHMAVGRFDPRLWTAYFLGNQPVAALLLNPLADQPELELVYLGIAPAFRNKGLATQLMRRAASVAASSNFAGIHLAVDEQNVPAVKLYRALEYRATARKVAMICTLSLSA